MKNSLNLESKLQKILLKLNPYLIIAPPRTASTSLARVLFNNSKVEKYNHEPCDYYCHDNAGIQSIIDELTKEPADLIKEMTFQMGTTRVAEIFLSNARKPVIFQIRHPFLTVESRIRMVLNVMLQNPNLPDSLRKRIKDVVSRQVYNSIDDILTEDVFPLKYLGWRDLKIQMDYCKKNNIPYIVSDARDLRTQQVKHVTDLCQHLGLQFEKEMIDWKEASKFKIANLPDQKIWYRRVVKSKGILPCVEIKISLDKFPERFRDEVTHAVKIYEEAKADSNNICK